MKSVGMKLTHWQWIQATKHIGNCHPQHMVSINRCLNCGWDAALDVAIKFVVE